MVAIKLTRLGSNSTQRWLLHTSYGKETKTERPFLDFSKRYKEKSTLGWGFFEPLFTLPFCLSFVLSLPHNIEIFQHRDFFSNSIIKDSVGALNSIIECKMSFPGRAVQRAWHVVDASSQTVGRLATTVAPLLKGKHKPTYRPNKDCGDYVVIVNAEKVSTLH